MPSGLKARPDRRRLLRSRQGSALRSGRHRPVKGFRAQIVAAASGSWAPPILAGGRGVAGGRGRRGGFQQHHHVDARQELAQHDALVDTVAPTQRVARVGDLSQFLKPARPIVAPELERALRAAKSASVSV